MDLSNTTPQQIEDYYAGKGKDYYKNFTTNQLRNFFSEIVSLRTFYRANPSEKNKIELRLRKLKAMLLYAEGKQTGRSDLKDFRKDVFVLTDSVLSTSGDFNNKLELFFDIMEGFVAYHKFYEEGKNL
ncbi:MAG: type III-A CRISPR-associated protein Csm2 [Ignavibacterium sp.]|jgi:CRISPR type III-A-associated protein Csm2|nr:type III-A CRISPR-associated protein Csm2 [Ignavibacterium sp.]